MLPIQTVHPFLLGFAEGVCALATFQLATTLRPMVPPQPDGCFIKLFHNSPAPTSAGAVARNIKTPMMSPATGR